MRSLRDGIYGLVVGDSLGVPFEFLQRGTFKATDMIKREEYDFDIGMWSDDSSMTLCTCDSIRENKNIDLDDMMKKFLKWYRCNEYTPSGFAFGIGKTTKEALINYEISKSLKGLKDEYNNGNGSLMRILPLIFTNCSDKDIEDVSSLTHGHKISIDACKIYIHIGRELLMGKDLRTTLRKIKLPEFYKFLKNLESYKEEDIKSSGYVVHTLSASLWCILNSTSYKEAVLKAVNLGDDTDTTAAVTGGLCGIIYGVEDIPKNWIQKIKNKNLIEKVLF